MEYNSHDPTSTTTPSSHYSHPPPAFRINSHQPLGAPPRRSRSDNCISRLMILLIMLFLIFSLTIFIAWLVIHPRDPAFRLESLSVSNITVSDSRFSANYDLKFVVNNTNKKVNLFIDSAGVDVIYEKQKISTRVWVGNMYIGKLSHGSLKVELGRDSVCSVKGTAFKDISDDWSNMKMVIFHIKMMVRTRFELGIWPSKQMFLTVSCMNLNVFFDRHVNMTVDSSSTNGTWKLMNEGQGCSVVE